MRGCTRLYDTALSGERTSHAAREESYSIYVSAVSLRLLEVVSCVVSSLAENLHQWLCWRSFEDIRVAHCLLAGRSVHRLLLPSVFRNEMGAKRILIVTTSHPAYPDNGDPTGLWLEELAAPYLIWTKAGLEVDIVSVKGGKIPLDPASLTPETLTGHAKVYYEDESLVKLIETTPSVKDVTGQYDAIYLPGGHGVCFDLATDKDSIALVEKFWAEGKVVSAVCHGPCALVNVKAPNGEPIVKGRKVNGFSNSEEEAFGKTARVPFLLESELIKLGGLYEKGSDWSAYAIADGNLITGQNPMSSEKLAGLTLKALGV